jgi:hypothetical protein
VLAGNHPQAVRCVVMIVLALATATMFAVSMRANYLYGYGIGQTPETQHAIAWANVGADLWKGFGLIAVVALWRTRSCHAAIAICATWLVCLSFSVSSAIGIYVQERTALTSGREAKHASYEDAKKELVEVEEKIRSLGQHRLAAQLEASIAGILARAVTSGDRVRGTVGTLSANCSRTDTRTAADCVEVADLRGELAVAIEAARLEARLAGVRQHVNALRDRGGSAAPDPVGEFWRWMTRGWLSVRDVAFGLPLFFAFMIEMVSAFGPVGIVAYAEATRPTPTTSDTARSVATLPVTARSAAVRHDLRTWEEVGHVVQYMADRTEPTTQPAALGVEELHADYEVWCLTRSLRALSLETFVDEFDRVRESPQLAGKIKKFGTRYFGIAFVDKKIATLPVQGS